ncbi:MAG TPA: helix-turn-helix domain-containing protein [Candidatus Acidoferrum sp.]|nr:helix-turn-helix domain-containing protein [Candidatus Acidoferrum sp.]
MAREYLWTADAAEMLGVSETVARKLFDDGKIEGFKIPESGYRRFSRESVERVRDEMRRERG